MELADLGGRPVSRRSLGKNVRVGGASRARTPPARCLTLVASAARRGFGDRSAVAHLARHGGAVRRPTPASA